MITSFRHKGLETFFLSGKTKGIQAVHAKRLRELLTALNVATTPHDLKRPSLRLHPLAGNLEGFYAMTVQANWRLTFSFDNQNVELLDYLDYH